MIQRTKSTKKRERERERDKFKNKNWKSYTQRLRILESYKTPV